MNPYDVLNLPPSASRAELRSTYLTLVKRWHPDRFQEGPERDWANDKMAEINAAYHACLNGATPSAQAQSDERTLKRIEELIDGGQYSLARRMLMSIATRCAEWNYLFGAMLLKLQDTHKAVTYLTVASHQQPDNIKYRRALEEARKAEFRARNPLTAWVDQRVNKSR